MSQVIDQALVTHQFPAPGGAGLSDKEVVIFGGSSGIGLAAAIQAKAAGARVTIVGSDAARAGAAAAEHGLAGWRVADVTRGETIAAALADLTRVDHLVLLAGTFVVGAVMDAEVDHLRRAFDERVWGAVHALRALGGRLAKDGSVTLISGALAERPNAFGTAILASASAAMEALARGLALELAPVRFNALSPGMIDTPMLAKVFGDKRGEAVEGMKRGSPQQRLGTAAEAGAAVVFLMANGWMNGATLHVDGGSRLL